MQIYNIEMWADFYEFMSSEHMRAQAETVLAMMVQIPGMAVQCEQMRMLIKMHDGK